jgi:hypothetical protein
MPPSPLLSEFALIYGIDWFVVLLPVRVGSVCRIASLVTTDTFGGTHAVPHYANTPDDGRWNMFAVTGDAPAHRLLLPPALARGLTSDAVEQCFSRATRLRTWRGGSSASCRV